ncbi:hypothetical protein HNY73_009470 [Argiope bruennichi]|uniref:Uncharacterized protein n=1 Tax=Argiope bruennichi TaxID=94029 RepID=A0A8T0FAN4_ARGBR|nr:hypothetical protein HNY73_009470 [Argiope bruennichi]
MADADSSLSIDVWNTMMDRSRDEKTDVMCQDDTFHNLLWTGKFSCDFTFVSSFHWNTMMDRSRDEKNDDMCQDDTFHNLLRTGKFSCEFTFVHSFSLDTRINHSQDGKNNFVSGRHVLGMRKMTCVRMTRFTVSIKNSSSGPRLISFHQNHMGRQCGKGNLCCLSRNCYSVVCVSKYL